jgi:peptide/nickel transport system substrate-binding protein
MNAHRERSFFLPRRGKQMQEQDNTFSADLSRRGVLMGAAAGGLVIAGGGAMLAPSANAAKAKIKKGGVLRIGVSGGGPTETQDAHLGGFTADTARQYQLYDRLVTRDSNFKLVLELADTFTPNKTGNIWTIRVKKGVKFHNGRELTADDVIFTINRVLNPATKAIRAGALSGVDAAKMKKVDKYTVSVTLKSANVTFDEIFSNYAMGIVPVGYNPASPVGTGPFKYKSFTPGVKSVYTKNAAYWRTGEPYVDSVEIISIPDETARVNALISGQVDAITDLPNSQVSTVKANKKLKVINAKTGAYVPIAMNAQKAPFNNPDVRKAFRLMIDREAVVKQAYSGYAQMGNDVIGRYDEGYNTKLPQRDYDPEKAKALLKKSGVTIPAMDLRTEDDAAGMLTIPQIFALNAKQAGVTVNVTTPSDFWDGWPGAATFQMDYYINRTYLEGATLVYCGGDYAKETGWSNPEFEALIAKALKTPNKALRNEMIADAQKIEYDDGAYIVTSFYNKLDASSAKVDGFGAGHPSGNSLNNFTLRSVGFVA